MSIDVLTHYKLCPLGKWLNLPALVSLSVKMGPLEHRLQRAVASIYRSRSLIQHIFTSVSCSHMQLWQQH